MIRQHFYDAGDKDDDNVKDHGNDDYFKVKI